MIDPLGVLAVDLVPDGLQQVGLAQPDAAVDEQRVPARRRRLGHHARRRVGELVGRTDHELVERVAVDQVGREAGSGADGPGTLRRSGAAADARGGSTASSTTSKSTLNVRWARASRSRRMEGRKLSSNHSLWYRFGARRRMRPSAMRDALDGPQPQVPVGRFDHRLDRANGLGPQLNHDWQPIHTQAVEKSLRISGSITRDSSLCPQPKAIRTHSLRPARRMVPAWPSRFTCVGARAVQVLYRTAPLAFKHAISTASAASTSRRSATTCAIRWRSSAPMRPCCASGERSRPRAAQLQTIEDEVSRLARDGRRPARARPHPRARPAHPARARRRAARSSPTPSRRRAPARGDARPPARAGRAAGALVDAQRLRQALDNLLDNAVRHARTEVRVELVARAPRASSCSPSRTTGPGIDARCCRASSTPSRRAPSGRAARHGPLDRARDRRGARRRRQRRRAGARAARASRCGCRWRRPRRSSREPPRRRSIGCASTGSRAPAWRWRWSRSRWRRSRASGAPRTAVLALRHAVAAGGVVRAGDVVAVPIAASDRTPSMLERARRPRRAAHADRPRRRRLPAARRAARRRPARRAPARRARGRTRAAPASAPDLRLLRRGPPRRRRDRRRRRHARRRARPRAALAGERALRRHRRHAARARGGRAGARDRAGGRDVRLLLRGDGS